MFRACTNHLLLRPLPPTSKLRTIPSHPQFFSSISSLLGLCTNPNHLQQIHARFILHGLHQNPTLSSELIDSYSSLGLPDLSQKVYDSITEPSSAMYSSILRSLWKFGEFDKTLLVYGETALKSMYPDEDNYPFVLKACSFLRYGNFGKMVHGHVVKLGFDSFELVGTALMDMYQNFGDPKDFIGGEVVDYVVYLNSLIFKACQNGNAEESFIVFQRMRMEGVEPDSVTFVNLVRSCIVLRSLKMGRFVQCLAIVSNLSGDMYVNTALLTMYSKLGSLDDARLLFDKMPERDCVVWNLIIQAYSRNGYPKESMELLVKMVRSGVRADLYTAITSLSSIAELKSLEWGKQVHANVIRTGSDHQVSVSNSLIDMYCKCNRLEPARKIFDSLTNKTVISWSSMIKGYVNHDQSYIALSLFSEMRLAGTIVDCVTVINILPACVNIGALEQVKYLHGCSVKFGLNVVSSVNTAILISYAKCGCLEMARELFDEGEIDDKDLIMWNSMISAYSKHGESSKCFELYNRMKQSKLKPDQVTFLGLLTTCVNSGFVKEGWQCFKEMTETYNCQPNQEHYACMVDLLGRSGLINEANKLIKTMPYKPDSRVWGPLLSACKLHTETRVAEFAAQNLIKMEPKNAGNYILLSNIYAAAGKWDGVATMRTVLRDKGLKKTPGCSWLEINGQVHEFRVADKSHPESVDIYTVLGNLELEIKDIRYANSSKSQGIGQAFGLGRIS